MMLWNMRDSNLIVCKIWCYFSCLVLMFDEIEPTDANIKNVCYFYLFASKIFHQQ